MKLLFVIAACAAVVAATPSFEQWKAANNKSYKTDLEEAGRRHIFEQNLAYVNKHNSEKHSYSLAMNKFADLTNDEFKRLYMPPAFTAGPKTGSKYLPHTFAIPSSVDWRTQGYVTPIKDQGQCGSCWAFSATGSLEGQHFKSTGNLVSLSEQNLVDCSGKFGNMGCNGGLMDYAFAYIQANNGIDTESSYPYTARTGPTCLFNAANVGATDSGFTDINSGDEQALTQAIATVGPISVAIDASHPSFQLYHQGVYNEPACSSTNLDHGVLAVGYGALNGTEHYIVKNSWGTSWGMQGYSFMSRDMNNQCGIATAASYPLV